MRKESPVLIFVDEIQEQVGMGQRVDTLHRLRIHECVYVCMYKYTQTWIYFGQGKKIFPANAHEGMHSCIHTRTHAYLNHAWIRVF